MKTVNLQEAREAPDNVNGLRRIGFIWRKNGGTLQWYFRSTLGHRGYPESSQFVPVYSPLEER